MRSLTVHRFRLETEDDSLQPTIDMLLNISVFLWYGAICPWASFRVNDVIPIYRLIPLGILILLFRRIPIVFALHRNIPQIEEIQQAAYVGFFGPIGVSAIFYLYLSIDFLRQVTVDGVVREDAVRLEEIMRVVVWFLAICSIVVHGLSVPLGKLGYHLPRTMSQALSSDRESESEPQVGRIPNRFPGQVPRRQKIRNGNGRKDRRPSTGAFTIGKSKRSTVQEVNDSESAQEPDRPVRIIEDTPRTGTPALPEWQESGAEVEPGVAIGGRDALASTDADIADEGFNHDGGQD